MKKLVLKYSQSSNQLIHCDLIPQHFTINDVSYDVFFDGELYNRDELIHNLQDCNISLNTSIHKLLLHYYLRYGSSFVRYIEGNYILILSTQNDLFIFKDIFGQYPLFYMQQDKIFYAANHLGDLLKIKKQPTISAKGLIDMFAFGPGKREASTFIDDLYALPMASMLHVNHCNYEVKQVYKLQAKVHKDNLEQTKNTVHDILYQSIQDQANNCHASFLSGGLDSSIISAVCAQNHKTWNTYSFDYEQNSDYFQKNKFQVSQDQPFIQDFLDKYPCTHTHYEIEQTKLCDLLVDAMKMRSMPGMADIDAALLWLCKQVKTSNTVILSGECSDELFGGYPWFYRDDITQNAYFPWLRSCKQRIQLLNKKIQHLPYIESMEQAYKDLLVNVDFLPSDSKEDRLSRIHTISTLHYFTQTLIMRQICASDTSNITIRVPFANIKLWEYVYNIPWSIKYLNKEEKGILRAAFEQELPNSIAHRKKNPFPKTHHPNYATQISQKVYERFVDPTSKLHILFDDHALETLIKTKGESFTVPFYGQLMSGPQLLAYIYQIDQWIETYHIQIDLTKKEAVTK